MTVDLAEGRQTRGSAHQRVYTALRGGLIDGHFMPGEVLTLRGIAARFETSPMPVREAFRQLVAERALAVGPGGSIMVPEMCPTRLADIRRIRLALEGLATEMAAARIGPSDLAALEQTLATGSSAKRNQGSLPNLERNRRFHFLIYRTSGSEVLIPLIESLWLQFGPYLKVLTQKVGTALGTGEDYHQQVIAALAAGDPAAARQAIEADISRAMDILLDANPAHVGAWIGRDSQQSVIKGAQQ
jgi:DNA-binding GntR family transcriptional regulator